MSCRTAGGPEALRSASGESALAIDLAVAMLLSDVILRGLERCCWREFCRRQCQSTPSFTRWTLARVASPSASRKFPAPKNTRPQASVFFDSVCA
jgi:hypothetical protein